MQTNGLGTIALAMSAARTERLLNLLTLLLNRRRPLAFTEIAQMEEFRAYGIGDRKSALRAFERDKASLVELGIPLRWVDADDDDYPGDSAEGGYVIDKKRYYLPELDLSATEMALLTMAGAAAAKMPEFPGKDPLLRALAKIGFDSGENEAAGAMTHAPLAPGVDADLVGRHLEKLQDAVARHQRLQMIYKSPMGERTERLFDAYTVYYRHGLWYAVGFCHLRNEVRNFHLGRIMLLDSLATGDNAADFEVPTDFDPAFYRNRRRWEFNSGEAQRVVIRFHRRLLPALEDILGPRFQRLENPGLDQADAVDIAVSATNAEALISVVLPYGADAQIISPLPLRQKVAAIYSTLAQTYGHSERVS